MSAWGHSARSGGHRQDVSGSKAGADGSDTAARYIPGSRAASGRPSTSADTSAMPRVDLATLSDDARVWIFAAERPVTGDAASNLLGDVDAFLERWHAHNVPLTCGRDWREDRFLVIAADGEESSGCSIDGLYRQLKALGTHLGTDLVEGGRVYYRDPQGFIAAASRDEFADLGAAGLVREDTRVFDTSLTRLGDVRERFETTAARSWHKAYLPRR